MNDSAYTVYAITENGTVRDERPFVDVDDALDAYDAMRVGFGGDCLTVLLDAPAHRVVVTHRPAGWRKR